MSSLESIIIDSHRPQALNSCVGYLTLCNFFGSMDVTNATLLYLRQSKAGRMVVIGRRAAWTAELPASAKSQRLYLYIFSKLRA